MPAAWADPAWRSEILSWASAHLEAAGHRVIGAIEQPHIRPWSTVFRIPTDAGAFWCKAAGPGPRHEAALLQRFATWGTAHVLLPLAADVERQLAAPAVTHGNGFENGADAPFRKQARGRTRASSIEAHQVDTHD